MGAMMWPLIKVLWLLGSKGEKQGKHSRSIVAAQRGWQGLGWGSAEDTESTRSYAVIQRLIK